jgi:hypothetical protein
VTRHLAAYWLKRAYELSGAPKPDGNMWHAFRRLWATERKTLPVKDVAAAGGWEDVTTLIECYQQPDVALRVAPPGLEPKATGGEPGLS